MTSSDPLEQLNALMTGYAKTQAIHAVAELGIPDLIADGTTDLEGLAEATGTNRDALFRLLRFLTSYGVFERRDDGYALTEVGQLLTSDTPGSRRAGARLYGRFLPAWGEILHTLRTGDSGYRKAFGKGFFEHFGERADDGAIFDTVMEEVHGKELAPISAAYPFEDLKCLMDAGGGNGSLLVELLGKRPELRGILFDLPEVVERSRTLLSTSAIADRCTIAGGNFFKELPRGADAILLRHILHDWTDAESITILQNCKRALPDDGRVLVAEVVMPEHDGPSLAKDFDLSMLVLVGGRERTKAEYTALFAAAGLRLTAVIETGCPVSLLEARPA